MQNFYSSSIKIEDYNGKGYEGQYEIFSNLKEVSWKYLLTVDIDQATVKEMEIFPSKTLKINTNLIVVQEKQLLTIL
jgi:hypothetical protein